MPAAASENLILAAILVELNKIGTPPANWLTIPTVAEGIPGVSVPTGGSGVRIYIQHASTEEIGAGTSGVGHWLRAMYHLWLVSTNPDGVLGPRAVRSLKADVLRALYAGEGNLQAVANGGVWPLDYNYQDDMSRAGMAVGLQVVKAEYEPSHTDP